MNTATLNAELSETAASHRSYDPAWFDVLAGVEEKHFWFRARNRVITAAISPLMKHHGPNARLLEVGCGNGNVLSALKKQWPTASMTGMDLFKEGLKHAQKKCTGCVLVRGDVQNAPFDPGTFDIVGMFDVLEHLPDDGQILRVLYSLLSPGGSLVLTVPACPELWSYFDEAGGHCRRYREAGLVDKIKSAGFDVSFTTPFMMGIFPFVWMARRWVRHGKRSFHSAANDLKVIPGINGLVLSALSWESWWIARRGHLPFGTSLLAVAHKPHTVQE